MSRDETGTTPRHTDGVLTDGRRRQILWGAVLPLATIAPLLAVAPFFPVVATGLLALVTVVCGIYMGVFGDRQHSEIAGSQAGHRGRGGDLPDVDVPESRLGSGALTTYTMVVTFLGMVSTLGVARFFLVG